MATSPFGNEFWESALSVFSVTPGNNVLLLTGGYVKLGRIVVVNAIIRITSSLSTDSVILTDLPVAPHSANVVLGFGYDDHSYSARSGGYALYSNMSIPSGECRINYCYLTS